MCNSTPEKRAKNREKMRRWRSDPANKERERLRNAVYRAKPEYKIYHEEWENNNPDKIDSYAKKYRESHREKQRERCKKWYWSDPIRSRKRVRKYREDPKRRQRDLENYKRWCKQNRLKITVYAQRRRVRKMGAPGDYSVDDIIARKELQDNRCEYCGITLYEEYHVDHRIPLIKGGTNYPDNLVICCPSCNTSKGTKTLDEWREVRGW